MFGTYPPKDSTVAERSLSVQTLAIPFKITAHASPGSKTIRNDEPSVLFINTQGVTQVLPEGGVPPFAPSIDLSSSLPFAVLGASTVTNTGSSVVTGDLGLYPGTSVVGFPPGIVSGTQHITNAAAQQAQLDALAAYNAIAGLTMDTDLTGIDLGTASPLVPGVYKFTTSAGLTGNLVLDAGGNADAEWFFQIGTTLTTASSSIVSIINGGIAANVYWQVGSSATLGTSSVFVGNIIADQSVTLTTSASVDGKLVALNAAVTLDTNAVSNAEAAVPTDFDLSPSDSAGGFNLLIDTCAGWTPITIDFDVVNKVMDARVISRITGVHYPCYPNASNSGRDSTNTKILLNCPSGINFSTTDLDAYVEVNYKVEPA